MTMQLSLKPMRKNLLVLAAIAACATVLAAVGQASPHASGGDKLQVYFVDVEGGQSTLFVTPTGQSLLIDTGWPGNNGRDADRIVAVAKQAGLSKIDYVLLTHYHVDHAGGVPQLLERIPVGTFIDHGPNREPNDASTETGWEAYQKLLTGGKYKHLVVKPGDTLPIAGLHAEVVSADGNVIGHPLKGAGAQNLFCAKSEVRPADRTENARSLGIMIDFGKLRILDLGDLTWDKERDLMCPVNKLGKVNILIVSHHGWNQSSSPALVDAIAPDIAIMDNGAKKGGSTPVLDTIRSAPGLQALWQLHFSDEGGQQHNTTEPFIANMPGADSGNYLRLTAFHDGKYLVYNSRTQADKTYSAGQ